MSDDTYDSRRLGIEHVAAGSVVISPLGRGRSMRLSREHIGSKESGGSLRRQRSVWLLPRASGPGQTQRFDRACVLKGIVRKVRQHGAKNWQRDIRNGGGSVCVLWKRRAQAREQKAPCRTRSGMKIRLELVVAEVFGSPRVECEVGQRVAVAHDQRAEQQVGPTLDAAPQPVQIGQLLHRKTWRMDERLQDVDAALLMRRQHAAGDRRRLTVLTMLVAGRENSSPNSCEHFGNEDG